MMIAPQEGKEGRKRLADDVGAEVRWGIRGGRQNLPLAHDSRGRSPKRLKIER
jgi:hypothetical protein